MLWHKSNIIEISIWQKDSLFQPLRQYVFTDLILCATGKTVEDLDLKLNNDMDCVNDWCNNNRMLSISDKTKAILIATYQKEPKLPKKELTIFSTTHNWKMWILKNVWVSKLTSTSHGKIMLIKQLKLLVET